MHYCYLTQLIITTNGVGSAVGKTSLFNVKDWSFARSSPGDTQNLFVLIYLHWNINFSFEWIELWFSWHGCSLVDTKIPVLQTIIVEYLYEFYTAFNQCATCQVSVMVSGKLEFLFMKKASFYSSASTLLSFVDSINYTERYV